MGKVKKITKKRFKQILNKDSEQMTVYEVLKAVPIGKTDLSTVFFVSALHRCMSSPPYSLRSLDLKFDKPLRERERLLISSTLRLICERGLIAADLIENGLGVEK